MKSSKVHLVEAVVWALWWALVGNVAGVTSLVVLTGAVVAGLCLATEGSYTEAAVRRMAKKARRLRADRRAARAAAAQDTTAPARAQMVPYSPNTASTASSSSN